MGRQFRFYLLPSDIERLVSGLREQFDARFFADASLTSSPREIQSVLRTFKSGMSSVYCYFTMAHGAAVKVWYAGKREEWLVDDDSDVIQFSGCDFEGSVLQIGRFYYQTNFVVGNEFRDKSSAFIAWAEQVSRATKKQLVYSPKMMAYAGEDAARWRRDGGRFAAHRRADGSYLYEDD